MIKEIFILFNFVFMNFKTSSMISWNSGEYFQSLPTELKFMIIENLNHNKNPFLSLKNLISFSRTNRENYLLSKNFLNLFVKLIFSGKHNIAEIFPKLSSINQLISKNQEKIAHEDQLSIEREIKLVCHLGNLNFEEVGNYVNNFCKRNLVRDVPIFHTDANGQQFYLNKISYSFFSKLLNTLIDNYERLLNKQCEILTELVLSCDSLNYDDLKFNERVKKISHSIQSILNQILRFKCWKAFCSNSFYQENYVYKYPDLKMQQGVPRIACNTKLDQKDVFTFKAKVSFESGHCDGEKYFKSKNKNLRDLLNNSLSEKQWFRTIENYF